MNSSNLPEFRKGQRSISAGEMNNLVRTVESLQAQVANLNQFMGLNTAIAYNKTGADLDMFGVVVMKAIRNDPATDEGLFNFKRKYIYEVQVPLEIDGYTHDYNSMGNTVGVLIEPCANESAAKVIISGPIQVQVDIVDEAHEWADPYEFDSTQMRSGVTGSAYILSKEEGTGTKWCQVILNAHKHAPSYNPFTALGTWDLQNQGEMDGEPATGVKFSIVTVDESYVPGSGETLAALQYDAHGHLVLVGDATESSSSQSSDSSGAQQSSASSNSDADESSDSGSPGYDCALCAPDPVRWIVTLSDWKFDWNGLAWDFSGTYVFDGTDYVTGTASYCIYAKGGDDWIDTGVGTNQYKFRLNIGIDSGPTVAPHSIAWRMSDDGGLTEGSFEWSTAPNSVSPVCGDYSGATQLNFNGGAPAFANFDANMTFKTDARF